LTEPLPPGPFGCILADPPWGFRTYAGTDEVPTLAADPYQTMSLDEMKALPVEASAAPDCLLVMWVISSHVPQALELAEAWGFSFRSLGPVWVKASSPDQLEMWGDAPISDLSMGYWFRQQSEIALVFGRGSPERLSCGVRQVIWAPRREHSRKPDIAHERVEALVAGPYLEMFGRTPRAGWTVWGNETNRFG
jgi:N6-adenosine-specific RNA methylase IME4